MVLVEMKELLGGGLKGKKKHVEGRQSDKGKAAEKKVFFNFLQMNTMELFQFFNNYATFLFLAVLLC